LTPAHIHNTAEDNALLNDLLDSDKAATAEILGESILF
jgi:hypothetical protein